MKETEGEGRVRGACGDTCPGRGRPDAEPRVVTAIALTKRMLRTIKQNFFWAFIYNTVLIPVAAGILYPLWAIFMSPILAGAAMALSSVSVVSNSLRLHRFPAPIREATSFTSGSKESLP